MGSSARIAARPSAAAAALLEACFQEAFLATFSGVELTDAERDRAARELVDVVVGGIGTG